MPSGMNGVADRVQDGLPGRRHLVRVQPLPAKQAVYRPCRLCGQKLALGIRPRVLFAGLQQYGPRCDQRKQHVRINRKLVDVVPVLGIVGTELIGIP